MNLFAQPLASWNQVFALFQKTSEGREVLKRFFRRIYSVRIESYPLDLRHRLLAVLSSGCPLGAAFVTDGNQGTIYVDDQAPLGILVPFLFHEMIHSQDETLWKAAQQSQSFPRRNSIIFEAECRAFRAQHLFQEELKGYYPDLRVFHESQYSHLPFLNRALTPEEIAALYRYHAGRSDIARS